MKKIDIFSCLFLVLSLFSGCKEENIIFDIEQPRFPLREGYELLELIAPYGTSQTNQIYIVGEFNGGLDNAIGDPRWLLEKAPDTDVSVDKWGIYLNPADFVNGKTLADGYYFYNIQEGEERSLDNQPVLHTQHPGLGKRLNVIANFWQSHFDKPQNPDEVTHDGYAIYVIDDTGYPDLALYAWGDAEIFGGWPGIPVTGRIEIKGVTYKYFDTGAANEGLNVNLIFNNNGNGSQLPDFNVTLDRDYYLQLSPNDVTEYDPDASITHDGYAVFVYNNTGWENVTLYMWGDVNDLNGGWPGMTPTGTQMVNGVAYLYFDMGEANTGLAENLIFSNDGANQLGDFAFTIDRDIYLEITTKGATEIDPETFKPEQGGGNEEPEDPAPVPGEEYYVYVQNQTGWSPLYLYTWNNVSTELCGPWPGISSSETKEIGGVTYTVFQVQSDNGENNLIFNDGQGGDGHQLDSYTLVLDKDYYLIATSTGVSEVSAPELPKYHLYISNQTGWDNFYVYAWGNGIPELFGGWPGASSDVTATVDSVVYNVFEFEGNGESYNLIFNNGSGDQYDALGITLDKDYYIVATATGATLKD